MVNDPNVVAEVAALHEEYEAALVSNDVQTLVKFFWDSPHALRFGVAESLYGSKQIEEFRQNRPPMDLARKVLNLKIVTFGGDCAVVTLEFIRTVQGIRRNGRQSQVWRKFDEGWKIVSAHVSLVPQRTLEESAAQVGLTIPVELREGVRQNVERASIIAEPLLKIVLDPDMEAAPVFGS